MRSETKSPIGTLQANRRQRLQTLEKSIRGTMEQFVETGNALKEIRDDELYREDGFDSWEAYLKTRVRQDFGIERSTAFGLITAAVIRPKLPDLKTISSDLDIPEDKKTEWSLSVVKEFARLAPAKQSEVGRPSPDVSQLRKQDVYRVAKAAVEIAKEQGKPVTAAIVREAVNVDLGIKPEKKVPTVKRDSEIELCTYLNQKIGQIEGIMELLAEVPADGWKFQENNDPVLIERFVSSCDSLAAFAHSLRTKAKDSSPCD